MGGILHEYWDLITVSRCILEPCGSDFLDESFLLTHMLLSDPSAEDDIHWIAVIQWSSHLCVSSYPLHSSNHKGLHFSPHYKVISHMVLKLSIQPCQVCGRPHQHKQLILEAHGLFRRDISMPHLQGFALQLLFPATLWQKQTNRRGEFLRNLLLHVNSRRLIR